MALAKDKNEQSIDAALPPQKPWKLNMKKLIERSKRIRELEANESKYKYDEE